MLQLLRRWHRSSRVVRVRVAIAILAAGILLAATLYQTAFFASLAYDPGLLASWPRPPRQFQWLMSLAQHANSLIRIPFDAAMAALFAGLGIGGAFAILWSAQWLFNLDRWKPPIEDRSRISDVDER